jgi:hypothetical protein
MDADADEPEERDKASLFLLRTVGFVGARLVRARVLEGAHKARPYYSQFGRGACVGRGRRGLSRLVPAEERTHVSDVKSIKYFVYKETPHFVAQCLNVDIASFGATADEAVANLKEAVELYLEDAPATTFQAVDEVMIGEGLLHA